MLKYIIEFLFCSAAFMAIYKLLLEGRVSHSLARNYLVVTMFVSLFIPMLELPLYPAETIYYEIPVISTHDVEAVDDSLPLVAADTAAEPRTEVPETKIITFEKPTRLAIDWAAVFTRAVWVIYLLITLLNLARFVWRIYIIGKLRRHSDLTTYELYTLAVSDRVREPFSFWRTIFTNRSFSEIEHRQIISHELSHIRHHHTAERLALELLRCVAWFNPFVWLAGTALVEVHEWEADSDVLSEGYDVYEYRQLIFRQLFGYHPNMTNGLSSQTSKKRFLMMTNFKKGKFSFVRFGAILPVVAVLVFAFGAVRAESEIVIKKSENSDVTPTPVYNAEVVISSAGELNFNGKQLSLDELKAQLAAESDKIEVLNIKAEKGARMGVLEDVKLAAREAKVFRIRYVTPPQNVDLLLPPLSVQSTSEVKVLRLKPDDRNRLPLFVNANGKVLTSLPDGDMGVVDMAQLKQIVKQFVDNTERVDGKRRTKIDHYSDFKWDTISMSDGGVRHYPVSCGYITIITTRDTDIDKYIEIEQVVRSAYAELRDELAQLSYRKSYASLDDDARSYIHQAIPIRINYADEYHPMFEKPVEPAQKVSVAVSPEPKVENQQMADVVAMPAEAPNKEPQQDFSIQPQHAVVQQTTNIKITKLPEGEFRLLSIGCNRNFSDYLCKKFFQSMPTITIKGDNVIISKHRCDDFIKPGTYDYKIFDDGVLALTSKSTQGTMPIKLNYKGKGNYEMEIQRSITYNGNRIESLIYYMAKWTGKSKTNLTAAMQREENVPAGRYKVFGFDTKREWTRVNDKAAKYIMFTAPTFIFGEDNTVEVISPGNNDYIKSGRYAYQMLLDDKKIETWQVIEKGKIVLTNKENTYTYPCVVKRAHNMRDALSYDLDIYINHNISNINIDVKYISFNSFE